MGYFKIRSHAKINLALNVVGKSHSLHKIETIISFLNLHDEIFIKIIKSKNHKIKFKGKFSNKISSSNTISRLLEILDKKKLIKNTKFQIIIKKNIPSKAGLGGGSMNAAAILKFLMKKKLIKISSQEMNEVCHLIGSDVILGLHSNHLVLKSNNMIKNFLIKNNIFTLIVKPSFGCSTKKIYSANKTFSKSEFNKTKKNIVKNVILNGKNDLEKSAFKLYPALKKIKNLLDQNKQARFVRMTGSGSAIIMYFNSNKFAKNALKIYKRKLNNCLCIITKTI